MGRGERVLLAIFIIVIISLVIAPFVVFLFRIGFIPEYSEICSKNQYTGQKVCAAYHIVFVAGWHVGEALNYYGAAITAIATGFVAAFTWVLARATGQLKKLAKKQSLDTQESIRISSNAAKAARDYADGMVNANIPFLDVVMLMDHSNMRNIPATPDFRPRVRYRFRNYGRSPATIIEFSDYLIVLVELPQNPIYPPRASDMPDREMVIAPNGDSREIPCGLVSDTETWEERRMTPDQFRAERQPFFLIGRVIYDDVFGFRHTKRYCWRYDVTPAGQLQFRPFGDQPYNRRRKEKSPYAE